MAKGRILAIDDEAFFRQVYQDLLAGEGYYVRTAAGGEEGLACLREEEFDLVVTDMEMPGLNGIDTTIAIKRFNPEQEVMVVTGLGEVAVAVEAMKQGVSEYLLKPIIADEFLLVINRILFRQAQHREHAKLMDENIEYLSILSTYQKCLAFLGMQDLNRLGDLILDTLMEQVKAEGGVLWLTGADGRRLELAGRRGLAGSGPEPEVFQPDEAGRRLLLGGQPALVNQGTGLLLPLLGGTEVIGLVRVEAPGGRSSFNRRDLLIAAAVGEFAVGALKGALFCHAVEKNVLRVPHSTAYNMTFFHDHLEKEIHKATRYGRNLSLLKLVVDNHAELNSRFLDRELETFLEELLQIVLTVLRDADILAMAKPGEYFLLLPETDGWGAMITQARIRKALQGRLVLSDLRKNMPVRVSLRGACCPGDGTSFPQLQQLLDQRLQAARASLWCQGPFDPMPFWTAVETLLGEAEDYALGGSGLRVSPRLAVFGDRSDSRYFRLPAAGTDEILRALAMESIEAKGVRGVYYRGGDNLSTLQPLLAQLEGLEQTSATLFLLGGQERVNWEGQRIVPIPIADERFNRMPFLLHLSEEQAYASFACQRGPDLVGFHTSDFYFVENMIARLQEQYQLQARI